MTETYTTSDGPIQYDEAETPKETFGVEPFSMQALHAYSLKSSSLLAEISIENTIPQEFSAAFEAALNTVDKSKLRTAQAPVVMDEGVTILVRTFASESIETLVDQVKAFIAEGKTIYMLAYYGQTVFDPASNVYKNKFKLRYGLA